MGDDFDSTDSPKAIIAPALLVWARENNGLSLEQAAKKIQIASSRLAAWENGEERPTVAQLRRVARAYKRPLAIFFMSKPPRGFDPMRDFRRAAPEHPTVFSPELTLEIRNAWERRQAALELYDELGEEPQTFPLRATLDDDPDALAHSIRAHLGVTTEEQFSWKDGSREPGSKAFSGWSSSLERACVLVFQTKKVASEEARGFSIGKDILPVIAVNGKDTFTGRTFTLLHELVHIMLRTNVLCDMNEEGPTNSGQGDVEVFCNRVAASALMPKEVFIAEDVVASKSKKSTFSDGELVALSKRYGVSREAVLRRLLDVGRVSGSFYERKRTELIRLYGRPATRARNEDAKGGPPQDALAVKYNGSLFSKLVISALNAGRISASEVHDYLDMRPQHIDALEMRLLKRSA
ncbi:ImmA/IrrE family metallo-endopeptidase [Sorangium sp. So ce1182]|uniref:ImmA/IrrE family metallo-endopeptidase n=1 Tax=Sorangium sp. So ce1182 TaxID=3133334 RepID=UPI003F631C17